MFPLSVVVIVNHLYLHSTTNYNNNNNNNNTSKKPSFRRSTFFYCCLSLYFTLTSFIMTTTTTAAAADVVATATTTTVPTNFPSRVLPSKIFQENIAEVYGTVLKLVTLGMNPVTTKIEATETTTEEEDSTSSFETVAKLQTGTKYDASVVFIVRRPGCILCREHGQQLTELATKLTEQKVTFWGIIKEINVDDEGLSEFYNQYYKYPLYRDVQLTLYKAFGNRKITLTTWNPIALYNGFRAMTKRVGKDKKIEGNLKGEGFIQGGILILNKANEIKYVYEEQIGTELEMDVIEAAIHSVLSETTPSVQQGTKDATEEL